MSEDERLRELARLAASGDADALEAYVSERIRLADPAGAKRVQAGGALVRPEHVPPERSGSVIQARGPADYVLPPPVEGMRFLFAASRGDEMWIRSSGNYAIMIGHARGVGGVATNDGGTIELAARTDPVTLAFEWVVTQHSGTWTVR